MPRSYLDSTPSKLLAPHTSTVGQSAWLAGKDWSEYREIETKAKRSKITDLYWVCEIICGGDCRRRRRIRGPKTVEHVARERRRQFCCHSSTWKCLCDPMPQSILFVTFHFLFIIQIFNRQIMMLLYCYTSSCFRFARRLLRWSSDAFIEREMHNQNLKGFSLVSLMCGQMQLPAKFRLS